MNLTTLTAIASQVDEKTFLERFPDPMLLVRKKPADPEILGSSPEHDLDWRGRTKQGAFATQSGSARPKLTLTSVEPLLKSTRNPFADMITVGRAPNNDVCLAVASVSKLHAYFQRDGAKWILRDSNSANGTFVNGSRLEAGKATPLDDGSLLAFGPDTECLFKTPMGLYGYLGQLARNG